jgi:hypothetical protein
VNNHIPHPDTPGKQQEGSGTVSTTLAMRAGCFADFSRHSVYDLHGCCNRAEITQANAQ